jgi:ABC-type protease/lipase transport system fused ATPase/permease subunit
MNKPKNPISGYQVHFLLGGVVLIVSLVMLNEIYDRKAAELATQPEVWHAVQARTKVLLTIAGVFLVIALAMAAVVVGKWYKQHRAYATFLAKQQALKKQLGR